MAVRRSGPGSPGETLAAVRTDLKQGWAAGLTLLTGDEFYHLDLAQQELLEALTQGDDSGFGLTVFDDDKVDVSKVISAVRSAGMFAERRVVLVRDVGILDGEPEALIDYAKAPPDQSFLVVRAPSLDRRRKLHKALAASGRLLEFKREKLSRAAVLGDIKRMAEQRKLKIAPRAAEFLAAVAGGDYYRICGELDKIRAWLGQDGGKVDAEVVREVAGNSGLLSGWEVADALMRRDRAAGLAAARRLVDAGDEPIRMVGGLAWRARVMLQAKAMQEAGADRKAILSATRAWASKEELFRGLSRYSMQELLAFPSRLLRADRTFKSRSIPAYAVLEQLVDGMTRPDSTAARGAAPRPRSGRR